MELSIEQRIVILEAAIKAIKTHEPNLESWCRDYLPKHIRIHIKNYIGENEYNDLVVGFLKCIEPPAKSLRPTASIQPSKEYLELYVKCKEELVRLYGEISDVPDEPVVITTTEENRHGWQNSPDVEKDPEPEPEPVPGGDDTPDTLDTPDTPPPAKTRRSKKKRK